MVGLIEEVTFSWTVKAVSWEVATHKQKQRDGNVTV